MENLILTTALALLAAMITFVVVVHQRQCRINRLVVERLVREQGGS
jgi:hypothetical protein